MCTNAKNKNQPVMHGLTRGATSSMLVKVFSMTAAANLSGFLARMCMPTAPPRDLPRTTNCKRIMHSISRCAGRFYAAMARDTSSQQ